jgi:hypothetical protein
VAKLCSAMAHLAQHRIELTEQERVELTRRAPAEKLPFQEVQRARIVLYASEGLADTEIAGRLDTTAGIVGKWRRRRDPAFAEKAGRVLTSTPEPLRASGCGPTST